MFTKAAAVLILLLALTGVPRAAPASLVTTTLSGTVYYFDDSATGCGGAGCSDSNPGTSPATAKQTMTTGLANLWPSLLPGDQVAFFNGDLWRDTFAPTTGLSGTAASRIVFTNYAGNGNPTPPIFDGTSCVGASSGVCAGHAAVSWTAVSGQTGIYSTPMATTTMGVFEDDPQTGFGLSRAACLPGDSCSAGTPDYTEIAQMTAGSCFWSASASGSAAANTLYCWLPDGSNPQTHVMEAQTTDTGIFLNGSDDRYAHFIFQNLQFERYQCHAIRVHDYATPAAGTLGDPDFNFQNLTLLQNGTGIADHTGYCNSLEFMDETYSADGTRMIDNTGSWCGGHNCLQVHGDNGSPIMSGNNVGPWAHNGIDVKMVKGAMVEWNVAHDGVYGGAGLYIENSLESGVADVTWTNNVVYHSANGAQCAGGGTNNADSVSCKAYNNTFFNVNTGIFIGGRETGNAQTVILVSRNNLISTPIPFDTDTDANVALDEDYDDIGCNCSGVAISYHNAGGTALNSYSTLAAWQAATGQAGLTIGTLQLWQVDPLFANTTQYNFALQANSPVIGKSNPVTYGSNWGAIQTTVAAAVSGVLDFFFP
jgi:hypothetical protein